MLIMRVRESLLPGGILVLLVGARPPLEVPGSETPEGSAATLKSSSATNTQKN